MTKRIVDLSTEELHRLADEAWDAAAREALAQGLPVTGSRDGRYVRYYPDGRIEDLGAVAPISDQKPEVQPTKKPRHSAA
jgi:hypothetical protein